MQTLVKFLFANFQAIYGEKWTRPFIDKDVLSLSMGHWDDSIKHLDIEQIKQAVLIIRNEFEWPPSIAEFLKVIDRINGAPYWRDALQLAIKSSFTHPAIKMAMKKVGEYELRHGSSREVERSFKEAYEQAIIEVRNQPKADKSLTRSVNE